jgi:hypothetical protein
MLPYGGYFNVMYAEASHSYHYGQKIELFDMNNFINLAKHIGYSIIGTCSLEIPDSLTPYSLVLKK